MGNWLGRSVINWNTGNAVGFEHEQKTKLICFAIVANCSLSSQLLSFEESYLWDIRHSPIRWGMTKHSQHDVKSFYFQNKLHLSPQLLFFLIFISQNVHVYSKKRNKNDENYNRASTERSSKKVCWFETSKNINS